jgi:ABC-type Mn2+/Zn2+ transport system permease subunit
LVGPAVAVVTGLLGFVLANYYDYPPGQTVTAVQCVVLLFVWFARR